MNRPPSKRDRVLKVLRERGTRGLTPIEAIELCGTMDLASQIRHLKARGHRIRTGDMETRYGHYTNDKGEEKRYLISSWVTYYYEGYDDTDAGKQLEMEGLA